MFLQITEFFLISRYSTETVLASFYRACRLLCSILFLFMTIGVHSASAQVHADSDGPRTYPALLISGSGSYAKLPHSRILEPGNDTWNVVSFLVKPISLPSEGHRVNILSKYVAEQQPYPGWAFAFRRVGSFVRPELYWQDRDGHGGWLTFERLSLSVERWHGFFLIVQPGQYVSLYSQDYGEEVPGGLGLKYRERAAEVNFLGGYPLTDYNEVQTEAPLVIGTSAGRKEGYVGEIAAVTFSQLSSLPETVAVAQATLVDWPLLAPGDKAWKLMFRSEVIVNDLRVTPILRGGAKWVTLSR
ncbi:MAG: hypothetical protein PHC51_08035 [bacterium]|nr:hypothetical protein [bacterium]